MINESTLNTLNNIGFGADIDSLESYISNYMASVPVADLHRYEYNYSRLRKLLKDAKPNSKVFNANASEIKVIELDKYDKFFSELGNVRCETVYGTIEMHNLVRIKNESFYSNNTTDLVAIQNIEGIDIKCTYINGILYRIYGISERDKIYDFTSILKDSIKDYIEEISEHGLVEVRAKVTLGNKNESTSNVICDTMGLLRAGINIQKLEIAVYDIFFDDIEESFSSYWDKLEFMTSIGLNVPQHCLLRNIDTESFIQALNEMDSYFKDDCSTNDFLKISGFLVKDNNSYDSYGFILCYDTINIGSKLKFESVVKSILTKNSSHYLKIVPVECNREVYINTIKLDDIYLIDKLDVHVGSKINFIVIEGKAILME